jgi:FkbM family methyltransferase
MDIFDVMRAHLTRDSILFDIGANVGAVARFAASLVDRVIAFEPQPDVFLQLRKNAPSNVIVQNQAVGATTGTVDFYVDQRDGLQGIASSMMQLIDLTAKGLTRKITVPCITLDQYVENSGIVPTFIKIDTEGCEPDVFTGGWKTITQHRPILLFEFWETHYARYQPWFARLSELYLLTRVPGGQEVLAFYEQIQESGAVDILARPR